MTKQLFASRLRAIKNAPIPGAFFIARTGFINGGTMRTVLFFCRRRFSDRGPATGGGANPPEGHAGRIAAPGTPVVMFGNQAHETGVAFPPPSQDFRDARAEKAAGQLRLP